MTRYSTNELRYVYQCTECGHRLPEFQGAYWLAREHKRGDGTIEVPYCPECGSESLTAERSSTD